MSGFSAISRLRSASTAQEWSALMTIFSKSATYHTKRWQRGKGGAGRIIDLQKKVPGYIHEALENAEIELIGGGGLGGEIGEALVRKGIGRLRILDDDVVEPSNLNRQKFYARDLSKNKAIRLARNLAHEGFLGTEITGVSLSFQE